MSFTVRYGIPMKGPGCARQVNEHLNEIDGVERIEVLLNSQEAVVTGEVAPSKVVEKMQKINRDAFVRGSGEPNTAAVAILETPSGEIKGLTRLISINNSSTLFDVSVDSQYEDTNVGVYSFGDMSNTPQSLGSKLFSILHLPKAHSAQTVSGFSVVPNTQLSDLIGRSVHTENGLSGIIARSAGLWENDKEVCACSGKSVWEERKDFREHTNGHL